MLSGATPWIRVARAGGAALALTTAGAVLAGTFVPLERDAALEHIFIQPTPSTLAAIAALAIVIATVLTLRGPRGVLLPVSLVALLAAGMLPVVPAVGRRGTVVAYFLYELRWWWVGAAVAAVVFSGWRTHAGGGGHEGGGGHKGRPYDAVLFVVLIAWAVWTMPLMRFDNALHGDEPKYLRYCETWYQGNGFLFQYNKPVDEWPASAGSALARNLTHAAHAFAEEARALPADLAGWISSPLTFTWNRAVGHRLDDGRAAYFLTGKHGGLYQAHMPGLSLLLMPGYYVDRHFLSHEPGYERQVPRQLWATNATMLLLYAFCGVALFRLLRTALEHDALAAAAALVAMITLPATSFAFQLYPEMPAALAIIISTNFVLFRAASASPRTRCAMGALAASLCWLHPRFALVSGVFLAVAWLALRMRRWLAYAAGWTAAMLTVGAYAYRLTGSWMPTAMYDVYGETGSFVLRHVPLHVLSNGFDRFYGVLPHSPLLLLVLPGLAVLARRRPRAAAVLALLGAALWIPAAGHGLGAAGGTPGRHVLAVLPLMIWPVAVLARTFRRSIVMMTAVALLAVLSIDAAYSYNLHHGKSQGRMIDYDAAGWKPNLAFPEASRWPDDTPQRVQLGIWFAALLGGTLWAFARAGRPGGAPRRWTMRPVPAVVATCALVIAGSTAVTAVTGYWYRTDYLMDYADARLAAAEAFVALRRCRVCLSSDTGTFVAERLAPTEVRDVRLEPEVRRRGHATVRVRLVGPTNEPVFGRVLLDFGDGTHSGWVPVVGETAVAQRYARPGTFTIVARVSAPGRPQIMTRTAISVPDVE